MSALPHDIHPMSETDYLAFEEAQETKHEYVKGKILSMAGASWNHNVISNNVGTSLNNQLVKKDCTVVTQDMRLKIQLVTSYRYPDVMVVCGQPVFVDKRTDTIDNPILIIEVLSPSTQIVDRNQKLREYRQVPSLQEYLLISQHEPRIEQYLRQTNDSWLYKDVVGLDKQIKIPALNCTLALADVYRKVTFESDAEE